MPSTTPDLSTVTAGGFSARGGAGVRSTGEGAGSEGAARPARRGGGTSLARARSAFGQASSKLPGGTSPASGMGGGLRPSGAAASAARARYLRMLDQNMRFRFGFAA